MPHLFEFMDLDWIPLGLKTTLREILECGNGKPFRSYYSWVVTQILHATRERGFTTVVELGAGTAPITRRLACEQLPTPIRLVPCDLNPDQSTFQHLAGQWPNLIDPVFEPVDFSKTRPWPPKTLVYLSATLHHIPQPVRFALVEKIAESADEVRIFEPLRKELLSILFVLLSLFPALIVPLWYINRPGRLRRFVWCWLIPIAPLMFLWDGFVSCIRQASRSEWTQGLSSRLSFEVENVGLFCQKMTLRRKA